jgi:hypothetical protein
MIISRKNFLRPKRWSMCPGKGRDDLGGSEKQEVRFKKQEARQLTEISK